MPHLSSVLKCVGSDMGLIIQGTHMEATPITKALILSSSSHWLGPGSFPYPLTLGPMTAFHETKPIQKLMQMLEHNKSMKTQAIYFSRRLTPAEAHLTLNGMSIPFVNRVKCLRVISDRRVTWILHTEVIEAKAFRTFIGIYPLFRSVRLRQD
jgi:hypothetical protein